jgi:hypothetical protein
LIVQKDAPNALPTELHYRVRLEQQGDFIRVHLSGAAANVLVMDDANLRNFREGQQYNYWGGYYMVTPVIIKPGTFNVDLNVIINLGGLPGTVTAVVEVIHPGIVRRRRR